MPGLWGEALYAGAARHYLRGRLPYPQRLADTLERVLGLTSSECLLDLGCGPGPLALLLAPLFADVLAVDADADMLRVAEENATSKGITNVRWWHSYAEDLPEDLGPFNVVTLAQSFHWMDQKTVATRMLGWLAPGGYCVHLGATTHQGDPTAKGLEHPAPPREQITELVRRYLGPQPLAGHRIVTRPLDTETESLLDAGFAGPVVVEVAGGDAFTRTEGQVVASVFSLSSAAPHLFGEQLGKFETDLLMLLRSTSPHGLFSEVSLPLRLSLWRPPG